MHISSGWRSQGTVIVASHFLFTFDPFDSPVRNARWARLPYAAGSKDGEWDEQQPVVPVLRSSNVSPRAARRQCFLLLQRGAASVLVNEPPEPGTLERGECRMRV